MQVLMFTILAQGRRSVFHVYFQMHSNKQNPVEVIGAGDIGAAVGLKDIRTGDTL